MRLSSFVNHEGFLNRVRELSARAKRFTSFEGRVRVTQVMKKSVSILSRVVSAVVGLFCGALLGMLALYVLMLLVGSYFTRPGAIIGAAIGLALAVRFPDKFTH